MRKFSKSTVAAVALIAVASLGMSANPASAKVPGPDYRVGNGWCC